MICTECTNPEIPEHQIAYCPLHNPGIPLTYKTPRRELEEGIQAIIDDCVKDLTPYLKKKLRDAEEERARKVSSIQKMILDTQDELSIDILLDTIKQFREPSPMERKWQRWLFRASPKKTVDNFVDIEELKRIPIEELYAFEKMRSTQQRISTLCPFHQERTPSFVVYRDTNTFFCFGACGQGGDNIDFIMKLHDCSFKEALKHLS